MVRPSDMMDQVTSWSTKLSRKEALACRWLLQPKDVIPVLGPLGAMAWGQHLSLKPGEDPAVIAREFEYTIETDSGRKLNKTNRAASINQAMQTLFPLMVPLAQATGDFDQVNALIKAWAEVTDLDPTGLMLKAPPPQPMMPPGAVPPGAPPPNAAPPPAAAPTPPQQSPEQPPSQGGGN